jgi:hypothetical protein
VVPQANCFWVDFGKIWQFWADLVAMAVATCMPSFEREKKNIITYAKSVRILHVMACWKAL